MTVDWVLYPFMHQHQAASVDGDARCEWDQIFLTSCHAILGIIEAQVPKLNTVFIELLLLLTE